MEHKISYDNMDLITPYPLLLVETIEVRTELGEHTKLTVRAILKTDAWRGLNDFLASTGQEDEIRLYLKGNERQLLFVGLAIGLEIEVNNDIYVLNLNCYSATYRMDQRKRKHTYQNPEMLCETLLQIIAARYQGGYLDPDGEGKKLGRMYLQYLETDWQFLKRVAADQGTVLAADAGSGKTRYFFGVPDGERGIVLEAKTVARHSRLEAQDSEVSSAGDLGVSEELEVESEQLLRLGNHVILGQKTFAVVGSRHRMEQGVLRHHYWLKAPFQIHQSSYRNEMIGGIALAGTVMDVKMDCVKVHFDVDDFQAVEGARWIPYAAESNQVWYSMPHKNERVFVHFPSANEEEAIIMCTMRGTSGGMSDTPSMSKPTEKCLETKWGKRMVLGEDRIDFQTPLIQALFLEDEIAIVSNDSIEITSETELNIGTSEWASAEGGGAEETADISIEAEERLSFVVTSTRTALELEENTDLYSIFKITAEGTTKATYPTITSEGMKAGQAAEQALAEKAAAEQAAAEQAAAEQAAAEQVAAEASKKEPLWKRIGKGAAKVAAGIAIGVTVVVAAPVIAAAGTAVAIAGCVIATGSLLVGASFFCEGANDIQLGIAGYSEEEVPSTDGMIGLTGQRMELMEGCVTAAMLVLTGAELVPTVAGMLGYGTYLLNEQISKLPPIWPSVTDGITGMSGGAATTGKVLDFVHVPAIPNIFAPAIPSLALIGNAQAVGILDEGIAKMTGSGGGSGGDMAKGVVDQADIIKGSNLTREQRLNTFDIPKEQAIAEYLEDQGRITIANELEGVQGAGRQGDAFVDNIKTEFKTLESGASSTTIKQIVNDSIRKEGQARNIIIDLRNTSLTLEEAEQGVFRALGISRGKIDFIEVIGKDFFFGYGPR